ncbi:MAG: arginase family protein [Anaerolineales bacterium]
MSETNGEGFLYSLMHTGVWGTFLRSPLIPLNRNAIQDANATVAILGAPWEGCESFRPGSSFGPQCIRQVTSQYSSYNCELDLDINDYIKLIDVGDIPIVPGNKEKSHNRIELGVREIIGGGAIPIVIGGDHSITYPVFTGLVQEKNQSKLV